MDADQIRRAIADQAAEDRKAIRLTALRLQANLQAAAVEALALGVPTAEVFGASAAEVFKKVAALEQQLLADASKRTPPTDSDE